MVGREIGHMYPPKSAKINDALFSVQGLSREPYFRDVNFTLRKGEILGFAGLVGAGRTEVARAVFGADRPDAGEIMLDNKPVKQRSPHEAIANGICYLTEDGISFHGTYWHNDFGKPRSHGCINLSPYDAWWLFQWSAPGGPKSPAVYVYAG